MYNCYKKRRAQKASIKEELMRIGWHPSRFWNCCIPEDEKKKETKKLWRSSIGLFVSGDRIQKFFDLKEPKIKMSSAISFCFNALELCTVIINEKPWTSAREVCRALRYEKKAAKIVKNYCSKENYSHKYELSSVPAPGTPAGTSVDWPKDSQNFDIYVNEEGMYELLFLIQQPRAKDFRRPCFNVLFPHVRQHFSDKSHAIQMKGLAGCIEALEVTNEAHQQSIEDKGATLDLMT